MLDFHQERNVFHRSAFASLLIDTPVPLTADILLHQVLLEAPNPWRDWIWKAYGTSIATCISRHTYRNVTIEPAGTWPRAGNCHMCSSKPLINDELLGCIPQAARRQLLRRRAGPSKTSAHYTAVCTPFVIQFRLRDAERWPMAKSDMIRARVEPELKQEAETVFSRLGLSTTQAITLFYKQVSLQQGLPFAVKIPNAETRKALQDACDAENLTEHESLDALKTVHG